MFWGFVLFDVCVCVVRCSLCVLFDVWFVLVTVYCLLCVACCALGVPCFVLGDVCCVVCSLSVLFVLNVLCLTIVVWWLSFVV